MNLIIFKKEMSKFNNIVQLSILNAFIKLKNFISMRDGVALYTSAYSEFNGR